MSLLNVRKAQWMWCAWLAWSSAQAAIAQAPTPNPPPQGAPAPSRADAAKPKPKPNTERTGKPQPQTREAPAPDAKPASKESSAEPPPSAAAPQPAAQAKPVCSLAEPEQPRGGRLDILGERFGSALVVRIAGKPARMLERRPERISVQIPADSDGGAITLAQDGRVSTCGTLVIIGKNR